MGLPRDGARDRVGLADEIRELLAARRQPLHRLCALHEQLVEGGLVPGQRTGDLARALEQRVQVLKRPVGLQGFSMDTRRLTADDVAQAFASLGVERVEDLVERDFGVGVALRDRAAGADLRIALVAGCSVT